MKINTYGKGVVIKLSGGSEPVSNAGGRGGGHRGGGGRHHGGGRSRPRGRGFWRHGHSNYIWNGLYWVDGEGLCYTKNMFGQYVLVDCAPVTRTEFGL